MRAYEDRYIGEDAEWTLEPVWRLWRREEPLLLPAIKAKFPYRPADSYTDWTVPASVALE
jgi:hypothetical protein